MEINREKSKKTFKEEIKYRINEGNIFGIPWNELKKLNDWTENEPRFIYSTQLKLQMYRRAAGTLNVYTTRDNFGIFLL